MGGNIFLVGMMGAGKTTLGKTLAQKTGQEFIDTDRVLVERTGVPVATIFEFEGEEGFAGASRPCSPRSPRDRAAWWRLAAAQCWRPGTASSCAGRERWCTCAPASSTCGSARATIPSRPLLATPDPRGTLAALLEQRDPLYREAAHLVVDTGSQAAATLVSRVLVALRTSTRRAGATRRERVPPGRAGRAQLPDPHRLGAPRRRGAVRAARRGTHRRHRDEHTVAPLYEQPARGDARARGGAVPRHRAARRRGA